MALESKHLQEARVPALEYGQPVRAARIRRWLRPGSVGFFLVIFALAGASAWGVWQWLLTRDERAFSVEASVNVATRSISFKAPPTRPALRHLARRSGKWTLVLNWSAPAGATEFVAFRGVRLANIDTLEVQNLVGADALLAEISRAQSGLGGLRSLELFNTQVTDEGLKELARSDTGLGALSNLNVLGGNVTSAGFRDLARSNTGLKNLKTLNLFRTSLTDPDLRCIGRADTGLKSLVGLGVGETAVTDEGLEYLAGPDTGFPALEWMDISFTQVTQRGVDALRKRRPNISVFKTN